MKIIKCRNYVLSFMILLLFSSYSHAQSSNGWTFLVAPYMWASSLNGDVTVKNNTKHVDIPFSKIIKHLDFGAEAHIEASHGPLTLMLDPTYDRLSEHLNPLIFHISSTSKMWLVDSGIFYRVCAEPLANDQQISLELLGGGRYLSLENTLKFAAGLSLSGGLRTLGPIVGARIKYNNPKILLWLRADVGGFDVDNMRRTWSIASGVACSVSRHVDLAIAYRVLDIDVVKSSNFMMNTRFYGPMLGAAFKF